MIIGTAGHIDHGKTALVRALTGVDADRLPEEKRRGMTIDLGFAYARLPGGTELGFVDVPGHERFVHNMLAGAVGIEFVLLVVAADDGPMPQTREHLEILSLLGLEHGVVALTKSDLVALERLAEAEAEVRALLHGSSLAGAEILPVSSATGEGVAALKERLAAAARALPAAPPGGLFRLAIDRSFILPGVGIVVTGTVFSGEVRGGDRLFLTPSGIEARVRGLHAQNRPAERGGKGERCALNIAGAGLEEARIERGDWLAAPELHLPVARFDARLRLVAEAPRPVRAWSLARLHLGTANLPARISPLEGDALTPGGEAFVEITPDRPIAALAGDRFILRDHTGARTIGGGVVVDPFPPARGRRRPERLSALAAAAERDPAAALAGLLRGSPQGLDLDRFALARALAAAEAAAAFAAAGAHALKAKEHRWGFGFSAAHFAALRASMRAALAAHHRAAGDSPGLERERLRLALAPRLAPPVFDSVLDALLAERAIALDGAWLRLPEHKAALGAFDQRLWGRIRARLDESRFDPPRVRDMAQEFALSEAVVRQLMKQLARSGELVEVSPDRFYRRACVAAMVHILAEMAGPKGEKTVAAAQFRDRIGTGRKLAILILEFFDRAGVTLRQGDLRKLRADRIGIFSAAPR
ncbi:MAG TPA: selenocysteine-specific translation elongation factor [Stellaceae bacterium]|nr:selenocysteine-specific translation elongation factor [Stellaceae bacterium]